MTIYEIIKKKNIFNTISHKKFNDNILYIKWLFVVDIIKLKQRSTIVISGVIKLPISYIFVIPQITFYSIRPEDITSI